MSPQVFNSIVNNLAQLNYKGRVELYIYNEPMKHRDHLERCVAKLRSAVPSATLMVSTNGDYMKTSADLIWLYEIGIKQVVLNAYTQKRYPLFKKWEDELHAEGSVQWTQNVYSKMKKAEYGLKVYDKSSPEAFGGGVFALQNRAGSIPDFIKPTSEPVSRSCVKPFRLLNINWNGQAMVCCNDYYGDVNAGQIGQETLEQIWFGKVLTLYRRKLMQKDRSLPLCRVCDCHAGAYPANIGKPDEDAQEADVKELETEYENQVKARSK
tara:strand:- start:333 stop:1133 length:801 start_codon:yes stop_codon:yes gene_type:complete